MKVQGPGNIRGNGSVRRTGKAEGTSGGGFAKQIGGEVSSAQGVSASAPLSAISSVLALQEVDDAAARASRGKMRAQEMLDKLDEIRHGLLAGALPRQKLMDLAQVVQSRRVHVDDPHLAQILDEIDLRAQVELAKLTS
ncbi:flagellar assembly protein FliX [Azospirillum sp. SYSU D00513]|uniref:flagellar assembly protein FliX n=1 Tax=Azospirillum sp. SYSU D00513 TaxID=2812561 RepID=UPI001A9623C9|nr:flagellar assembly protein FliX [Azospirillum sp. SYSU D00513]